jgi:hypothetical protein
MAKKKVSGNLPQMQMMHSMDQAQLGTPENKKKSFADISNLKTMATPDTNSIPNMRAN